MTIELAEIKKEIVNKLYAQLDADNKEEAASQKIDDDGWEETEISSNYHRSGSTIRQAKRFRENEFTVEISEGRHILYKIIYTLSQSTYYLVKNVDGQAHLKVSYVEEPVISEYKTMLFGIEFNPKTLTVKYVTLSDRSKSISTQAFKDLIAKYYLHPSDLKKHLAQMFWSPSEREMFLSSMEEIDDVDMFLEPLVAYLNRRVKRIKNDLNYKKNKLSHLDINAKFMSQYLEEDGTLKEPYCSQQFDKNTKNTQYIYPVFKDKESKMVYLNQVVINHLVNGNVQAYIGTLLVLKEGSLEIVDMYEESIHPITKLRFLKHTDKISSYPVLSNPGAPHSYINIEYEKLDDEGNVCVFDDEYSLFEMKEGFHPSDYLLGNNSLSNYEKLEKSFPGVDTLKLSRALKNVAIKENDESRVTSSQPSVYKIFGLPKNVTKELYERELLSDNNFIYSMPYIYKLLRQNVSVESIYNVFHYLNDVDEHATGYYHRRDLFNKFIDVYIETGMRVELRVFLEYISDIMNREFIQSYHTVLNLLSDTYRFASELNEEIRELPKNLTIEHNKMTHFAKLAKNEKTEASIQEKARHDLEYEDEEYSIIACTSSGQLIHEGSTLNHCVGSYSRRIINGDSAILFLRNKDDLETPFITIEVRNDNVTQIQGKSSRLVKSLKLEVRGFIVKWMEIFNLQSHLRIL